MSAKENAKASNRIEILVSPAGLGDVRQLEALRLDLNLLESRPAAVAVSLALEYYATDFFLNVGSQTLNASVSGGIGSSFSYSGTLPDNVVFSTSNGSFFTTGVGPGAREILFSTNVDTGAERTPVPLDPWSSPQVLTVAVQSDGKLLVGGRYDSWDGTLANHLVRLNADGTLDTSFVTNLGTGAGGTYANASAPRVVALAVQSDGKILVGGTFESWDGTATGCLARLNSDGTLDTSFMTNIGTGATRTSVDADVEALAVQSDGKILVGGRFDEWDGVTSSGLIRLDDDGTLDTGFTFAGYIRGVGGLAVQSDDKIVAGGDFKIRGVALSGSTSANINTKELTSDVVTLTTTAAHDLVAGDRINVVLSPADATFDGFHTITAVTSTTLSYAKVAANVAPTATTGYVGSSAAVIRVNTDGTLDTGFDIGAAERTTGFAHLDALALQTDGKIVAGGLFESWDGTATGNLVRLNDDGTLDTSFVTNLGTGATSGSPTPGTIGPVFDVALLADDSILVGGGFGAWDGTAASRLVRLNSDGTRDTAFPLLPGSGIVESSVYALAPQADDKIVVGGSFAQWDGVSVGRIVRLLPAVPTAFPAAITVTVLSTTGQTASTSISLGAV